MMCGNSITSQFPYLLNVQKWILDTRNGRSWKQEANQVLLYLCEDPWLTLPRQVLENYKCGELSEVADLLLNM